MGSIARDWMRTTGELTGATPDLCFRPAVFSLLIHSFVYLHITYMPDFLSPRTSDTGFLSEAENFPAYIYSGV